MRTVLTTREVEVLVLVADGLTARAVGRRLGCARRTVEKHLEHIYPKLEVDNVVSAVLRAQQLGVIRPYDSSIVEEAC